MVGAIVPVLSARRSLAQTDTTPKKAEDIDALIRQLGDEDFDLREEAAQRLTRLGPAAFDALAAAENDSRVDVARRAKYLLRQIRVAWTKDTDSTEVRRLLRGYDELDARGRRARIDDIARLPADQTWAPLCRIVRFEKSTSLAKLAALAVIEGPPADALTLLTTSPATPPGEPSPEQRSRKIATIRETLAGSKRPVSAWLLADARYYEAPDDAIAAWAKIVDAESQLLKADSDETSVAIVGRLVKRQYTMLVARGRRPEAIAALRTMVAALSGRTDELLGVVPWLASEKAWEVVDEVATRFETNIARDPILLYTLADARLKQGRTADADALAAKALALRPENLQYHAAIGYRLSEMGLFSWAEREWRSVIERSPSDIVAAQASMLLVAMLKDQERYQEGAQVAQAVVKLIESKPEFREQLEQSGETLSPDRIRAAMDYCYGMYFGGIGDRAKQTEHLERALHSDPLDADVLIALYRIPDASAAQRDKTIARIKQATISFNRTVVRLEAVVGRGGSGEMVTAYNNYAWLVANTFGDFDTALAYSIKSNEMRKDEASILDTLSHCYYAKGDLDNALKTQQRANRLDPHSGSIARKLHFFQAAVDARNAKAGAQAPPRASEP
jgi:tetratricopeptide (TPR) repeat protein